MTVKRIAMLSLTAMLILVIGYYFYLASQLNLESRWAYQLLFISIATISALCVIILFLNRFQSRMDEFQSYLDSQLTSINDINRKMDKKKLDPNDASDHIEKLLVEVKSIREKVDSLAANAGREDAGKASAGDADKHAPETVLGVGARGASENAVWEPIASETLFSENTAADEGSSKFKFPCSVKDCLNYLERSNAYAFGVKAETLQDGIFVRSQDGPFLLIEGGSKSNNSFFIVPRIKRFTTTQDYDHYRRYYECANPTAGEVWIVKPAIVITQEHEGEWKLTDKGHLKVES